MKALRNALYPAVGLLALAVLPALPAAADNVISDDLIVQGSICVGFDCVNGESFGFDTLRLKENNTRLHFDDTSNSASFPRNDWRLVANDSSNGGDSYLGIEDSTAGRRVATFQAGARANSLFVRNNGNVGFGTATPVTELHVADGDTPTLRLEQNGSSGFTPQTWDLAGNETNIFIRDATNGSRLPFRIRPGAPTSTIDVAGSGNVGMGTSSPDSALHIRRTDGTASLKVEEASGSTSTRALLTLVNNGGARLRFDNTSSPSRSGFLQLENSTNAMTFREPNSGPGGGGIRWTLDLTTGDVSANSFIPTSSRERKTVLGPADPAAVLAKVVALPVSEWAFKHAPEGRHLGPMAEDFYAAFGLGTTDKGFSLTDTSGVALAAIQGLHRELEARDRRISNLEARLAALEAALGSAP